MNTKFENVIPATFAASAFMISLLIVGSAFAASPGEEVKSQTVKFADLNLQTDEGVAALYQRIHAAAQQVCDMPGEGGPSAVASTRTCIGEADARAIMRVNVPALSAYYEEKTGRSASTLLAKAQ